MRANSGKIRKIPEECRDPAATRADPTRSENLSPATQRRRPGHQPIQTKLAVLPLPTTSHADRRKDGDRRQQKSGKVNTSPAPIPATSGRSTTWVLLLSSPATHPWSLIIPKTTVHGGLSLGRFRPPPAFELDPGRSGHHLTSRQVLKLFLLM